MVLKVLLLYCVFLVPFLGLARADLSSEYGKKANLDGKFTVYWSYNATNRIMYMAAEAKTTGWVSFGFAKEKSDHMEKYDVAIGKVEQGTGEIKDYLTNGHDIPRADSQQDFKLTFASEEDGVTTLKFYRKIHTGDSKDIVIEPGEILTVWAYRKSDLLDYHDQRGFQALIMIPSSASLLYGNTQHIPPLTAALMAWIFYQ